MPLITIVEDYVQAAIRLAVAEPLEGGVVGASIPDCPGVLAFGADVHECASNLYVQLQDWVKVSLERGNPLPVIGEIDLNSDRSKVLASYHRHDGPSASSEFFDSDEAFEEALKARSQVV